MKRDLLLLLAGSALCTLGSQQALAQATQPETHAQATPSAGRCNAASVTSIFADDANTKVRVVKAFAKGEPLTLEDKTDAQKAPSDLCVVKLMVGPGNPGPAEAPSTSEGIGIEIWLPSPENWNGRIHNLGSGGLDGIREVSSLTKLGAFAGLYGGGPALNAARSGSVSAISDSGHSGENDASIIDGSFLMNPDGSINETLAKDFSGRAGHEMAVKTKQLVQGFYGKPANHAYFAGCSNGGRQALKAAQDYPQDYDGIISVEPAIDLSRIMMAAIYPSLVTLRELGGKAISPDQLNYVSAAAVSACDTDVTGKHSGYISNLAMCRYNPAKDANVLCASDGGKNSSAQCITRRQASAINKIWYGPTRDGSASDPATGDLYSTQLSSKRLGFGIGRGAQLVGMPWAVASSTDGKVSPSPLPTHFVALFGENPSLAAPDFRNATGNGANGWLKLTYAELARIAERGLAMQAKLGHMDADNPDLSAFKARGGKLIGYQGTGDQIVPVQNTDRYYEAVARKMGGLEATKSFYRYYHIPAFGHCSAVGQVDGLPGVSPKAEPPLPRPDNVSGGPNEFFEKLVAWVEQGKAPEDIVLHSVSGKSSRPVCTYPKQVRYNGGDPDSASSFSCEAPKSTRQ